MIFILATLLPIMLWSLIRLTLHGAYEMDPGGRSAGFHLLLPLYLRFFYTIALLSLAAAAGGWYFGFDWPASVLLVAGVQALTFNILLIYFYESYEHAKLSMGMGSQSNYGRNKYALILALGFSSFVLFVGGTVWMAATVTLAKVT